MWSTARRGLIAVAALAVAASPLAASPAAKAQPEGEHTLIIRTGGDRGTPANGTATGGAVSGVADVVYRLTGHGVTETCTSNAAGNCTFDDLVDGTYTAEQVSVPTGSDTPWNNYFLNPRLGVGPVAATAGGPTGVRAVDYHSFQVDVSGASSTTYFPVESTEAGSTNASDLVRSGRWAVSRYNPPPPATCTRRVALLFDLSASITQTFLDRYKTAATGFVRALLGTSTQVTIYTFGTTAPAPGSGNSGFVTESTEAIGGVNALVRQIDGLTIPSGQFTNWDAGIGQIARSATVFSEALALTDGDPTAMSLNGQPDSLGAVRTRLRSVEAGIFSANALKARGTRVIAVGLAPNPDDTENAGSIANLNAISGPNRGSDYYLIPFDTLEGVLQHLAVKDCAKLSITKTADPRKYHQVGQVITYTYQVTNTSPDDGFTLFNVTVHDNRFGTITNCVPRTLPPGSTATCTATHRITQADLNAGHILNSAFATGSTENGTVVDSLPDDEVVGAVRFPQMKLTKTPNLASFDTVGQTITYTYVITNTGNVTLTNIRLTDNKIPGPFTCTPALGSALEPSHSMTCTATHTVTQADLNAGSVKNRATAIGQPPDSLKPVEDSDDAIVPAANRPAIKVAKEASPEKYSAPGQAIRYTYIVTNIGNVALSNIAVHDSVLGTITCPETTLAPDASMTCHATHITTQADLDGSKIVNTVIATGHPPTGPPVTDQDEVEVTGGLAPSLDITKSARPSVYQAHGQVITYTYLVTNSGNLTLRNVALADSRFGRIGCPHATLAPGVSMTCQATHAITAVDLDEGSIRNSAFATGHPPNGGPVRSPTAHALVTGVVVPEMPEVPVTG